MNVETHCKGVPLVFELFGWYASRFGLGFVRMGWFHREGNLLRPLPVQVP